MSWIFARWRTDADGGAPTHHGRRRRAGAVGVVAVLALAGCGGDDDPSGPTPGVATPGGIPTSAPPPTAPAPTTPPTTADEGVRIDVTVRDGSVVGGVRRQEVPVGADVVLLVDADLDEEIHVHGYDHAVAVAAGEPAELRFTADIPGVFEVELEDSGLLLLRLQVA